MLLDDADVCRARVLVVDDNPLNRELVADTLEDAGCEVVSVGDGEAALERIAALPFDVVLLDVMMPGLNGYQVCERLKRGEQTKFLPVVMITALDKREDRLQGIRAGADDFLMKPIDRGELLARVQSCVRLKRLTDDLERAESVLLALTTAIEAKDSYTEGHAERVAHYAVQLGKQLGLPAAELRRLRLGGLLHDVGKIGVPEAILNKPGPLDEAEWQIMRKHPEIGDRIARPLQSLRDVIPIIRSHHERPDGSGYPDGLRGDEVPLEARIVGLADIYDALATTRSYKRAFPRERSIAILGEEAAAGKLDRHVVDAFITYLLEREESKRAS